MNNIKFSVIVPVYNVEKYLKECIESILEQTYANYEIILIDDGSTDLSGNICDTYNAMDSRIKVIHQVNQGHTLARRKGISNSTGDFCLFLDSDDYWERDVLKIISEIIDEYNCDLVIFNYKKVTQNGAHISYGKSIFKDRMIFEKNKEELFIKVLNSTDLNNLWNKVVRRTIIDDLDYAKYKNIKSAEDLLQSLPFLYNAKKIIYINNHLYNYRMVATSITHTFNISIFEDITIVRQVVLNYLQLLNINNEENLIIFYQYYISSILRNIYRLVDSNIVKEEKFKILDEIQGFPLYIDAIKYSNKFKFYTNYKLAFFLFRHRCFRTLFVCIKLAILSRSIKSKLFKSND